MQHEIDPGGLIAENMKRESGNSKANLKLPMNEHPTLCWFWVRVQGSEGHERICANVENYDQGLFCEVTETWGGKEGQGEDGNA